MKKKYENEGITLIVLVITIVIMLILVGVTVNIAIDGNLFNKAGEAVDKTNAKVGKLQQDVDYYTDKLNEVSDKANEVEHNWTRNGETFKCLNCRKELEMGQQIMYTDTGNSSSIVTTVKSGSKSEQTITKPSNIRWVVFGIEDNDCNGTNESLLITTVEPVYGPYFAYPNGYNNGEEELNRVCRELYGSNARSMTLVDIENTLQYRPSGAMYGVITQTTAETSNTNETTTIQRTSLNIGMVIQQAMTKYKTTGNFTTKLNQLEIWDEIKANGTNTPDGANTEMALGNYTLNAYVYFVETNGQLTNPATNETQNIDKITRDIIFGTYNSHSYNLATKVVDATTAGANFGLTNISGGNIWTGQMVLSLLGEAREETQINLVGLKENNVQTAKIEKCSMLVQHNVRDSLRPVIRITNELFTAGEVITEYGSEIRNEDMAEEMI